MNALLKSFPKMLLGLVLAACGGGSTDSQPEEEQPRSASATLTSVTKPLSAAESEKVVVISPTEIISKDLNDFSVGDVIVGSNLALKVASVERLDSQTQRLVGTQPGFRDVFTSLDLSGMEFYPRPEQFVVEDSAVTVSSPPITAMRSSANTSARVQPKAASETTITIDFTKRFATGIEGVLSLTLSPKITINIIDTPYESLSGLLTFRANMSGKPSLKIKTSRMFEAELYKAKLGYFKISIPIAGPLAPGALTLKVPIEFVVKLAAGDVEIDLGARFSGDYGFALNIESRPDKQSSIGSVGDGLEFSFEPYRLTSLDSATLTTLSASINTGVSLSVLFGLADPLAAIVEAGVKGDLTQTFQLNAPIVSFEPKCIGINVDGYAQAKARIQLFGPVFETATIEISKNLYESKVHPNCPCVPGTDCEQPIFGPTGLLCTYTSLLVLDSPWPPLAPCGNRGLAQAPAGIDRIERQQHCSQIDAVNKVTAPKDWIFCKPDNEVCLEWARNSAASVNADSPGTWLSCTGEQPIN